MPFCRIPDRAELDRLFCIQDSGRAQDNHAAADAYAQRESENGPAGIYRDGNANKESLYKKIIGFIL